VDGSPLIPVYKTSDTATAAYLCCKDFKLVRMKTDPNNRTVFIFENSSEALEQAVHDFEIGAAVGNITSFFRQYRRLLREVRER
jgi:hypothetical protein